jgi:peptide/nickel transport system substrate-binding protein
MRSRSVQYLVVAASLALVLGACGPSATTSPGATTGASPGGTAAIPEVSIIYAYHKAWPTLDPTNSWSGEPDILAQIFETLTAYNTNTNELEPHLATSWDHNEDSTQWTFHLREGVTFHDGAPFNAEAVKLSLERNAIGEGPAYLYEAYESIEVVDDLTLTINLTAPQPLDFMFSAGWGAYILSPDSVAQPQEWFEPGRGAGTGPYRWVSYEPNQEAVIERFPEYWGGWEPGHVTRVVYQFVSDAATRQQMLTTGQADIGWSLPTHSLPTLAEDPNVNLFNYPIFAAQMVLLNTVREPTDDPLVRRALAAAFPVDDIIATTYEGDAGYVTKNVSSFGALRLGGGVEGDGFTYDLDLARDLLAEAGIPDGGISFDLIVNNAFPDQLQDGELWKASLAEIGVTLNLLQVDSNQYSALANAEPPERPAFFSSWTPDYPSPQNQMFAKFGSTSSSNDSSYNNPEFDALLAQGVEEMASDPDAAMETFAEANAILFEDMPGFPYLDKLVTYVTKSTITGVDVQHCGLLDLYSLRVAQ